MRRSPLPLALLATGGVLAALAVAAPATAAPTGTAGLQYVALGDSYAAGFGITPSVPAPPAPAAGCLEAEANYPRQVAAQLGLQLTDVTCTGAITANIIATPQPTPSYFGGGTAQPQSLALSADTDVVTVSIGGNDAGFAEVARACIAETATGPTASGAQTCQELYVQGGVDSLAVRIQTTVAADLAAAYGAIRAAAPNAAVFVVGYPSLFPDAANTPAAGCFTPLLNDGNPAPPYPQNSVPFTDVDVPYISSVEVLLNQTIATAATNAGFTFIDNRPGTVAHSVCPQVELGGTPFINGLTVRSLTSEPLTVNGGLHPNAAGVAFLTAQTSAAIAAAFPAPIPTPTPAPVPALPATGPEIGPTIALVAASAVLMAAGGWTMARTRRRAAKTRR